MTFGKDFKRKNDQEERKEKKTNRQSNGSYHSEGFRLMGKKRERKVNKRRDKYILLLLIT